MSYRIDDEAELLKDDFNQLLSLEHSLKSEMAVASIRPYIAWQINSFVECRLSGLCDYQKTTKNLVDYRDVSINHGLNAYHDYLTNVALLNLGVAVPSLNHLRRLQSVLRYVAHGRDHDRQELEHTDGIDFDGWRIVISDGFIWESLDHARTYLNAVPRI